MPPGTGDVALSLSQLLPLRPARWWSARRKTWRLLDAVKAIAMFRKVNLDVFGMVENMSFFVCPHCGAGTTSSAAGGAKRRAAELEVPFLGEVPLLKELRVMADEGRLAAALDYPPARPYLEAICQALVGGLAARRRAIPGCRRCRCWNKPASPRSGGAAVGPQQHIALKGQDAEEQGREILMSAGQPKDRQHRGRPQRQP